MNFNLSSSPTSFYDPMFLDDTIANKCFDECNKLTGWKKNTVISEDTGKGYLLGRETLVFVSDEIKYKLVNDPKHFQLPTVWGKDVTVITFDSLPEVKLLKDRVELKTGCKYNIALGNRYCTGKDKISFHSDNEEFGNTQSIASISLGIPRTFSFISKEEGTKQSLILANGSLLFMGAMCQENYIHGMFPEKTKESPIFGQTRINITFRVWNYTQK